MLFMSKNKTKNCLKDYLKGICWCSLFLNLVSNKSRQIKWEDIISKRNGRMGYFWTFREGKDVTFKLCGLWYAFILLIKGSL